MYQIKIKAPAKVNLSLQVLNKRADGFHNINSIMCPISLHDEIEISKAEAFSFTCDTDLGIKNEDNLVYKAAKRILEYCRADEQISINLKKNIPSGGGLGGGSSDAANVLTGIAKLLNLNIHERELFSLAEELGSDVPFFVKNSSAIVTGRGENLQYIDFSVQLPMVLIAPNFSISTAGAYSRLQRTKYSNVELIDYSSLIGRINSEPELMRQHFVNDFVHKEMEHYDDIMGIISDMYSAGAVYCNMSGSGSCCYAFFREVPNLVTYKAKHPAYILINL